MMTAAVVVEAVAGALLTEVVARTARLLRHPMGTIRRWEVRPKRRDTLRLLPATPRQWSPAAQVAVEQQPRETGPRMTHPMRLGSLRADRGILDITTSLMQSDGQWGPGRARRIER